MKYKRIFRSEEHDWRKNAIVGGLLSSHWGIIEEGYFRAAELLVDEAIKNHEMDLLVFPICFLYRHFIEIALKGLILQFQALKGEPISLPKTHNIGNLLNDLKSRVSEQRSEPFSPDVESLILEFAKVDPTSQAFRYITNKEGGLFFKNQTHIGLGNLKERMNEIADYLLAMSVGLDVELDLKSDYDAEVRSITEMDFGETY